MKILKNGNEFCDLLDCRLANRRTIPIKTFGGQSPSIEKITWMVLVAKRLDDPKAGWSMMGRNKHYRIAEYKFMQESADGYAYQLVTDHSEDLPKPSPPDA